jgi:hypothetical protein
MLKNHLVLQPDKIARAVSLTHQIFGETKNAIAATLAAIFSDSRIDISSNSTNSTALVSTK